MTIAETQFKALTAAATDLPFDHEVRHVLGGAEDNAVDTVYREQAAEEFYTVAVNSIGVLLETATLETRDWFRARGYAW